MNDDGFNESNATTQLLASKYVETFYTNIRQDSYTTHEIIKKLLTSCVCFLNSVKSIPLDASIIVSKKIAASGLQSRNVKRILRNHS